MLTDQDVKKLEKAQPILIALYRDAGYERAISLQKEIEELTGKSIFYIKEIEVEAANCFHTGTWQVWHGEGVADMKELIEYGDYESVDEAILDFKENAASVSRFVEVAEEYLRGITKMKTIEKGEK